ncbi:MAG: FAD-binding oxidoreductase, partial [Ignavibacteriae bacterium]|nr:FAD-binding oxidoreductase [Ignavibacteriota bacterium]
EHFLKEYNGIINLASGTTFEFRIPNYKMPKTKHAAAYWCKPNMDLIDLFIGSEGTLGFITKIKLRLSSISENILSMLIYFENENDSFTFVEEVRSKSKDQNNIIDFRELEFIDNNSLDLIRDEFPTIPISAKSAIYIEQEYSDEIEDDLLREVLKSIENNNGDSENIWFAQSEKETENIKAFRHAIPIKINEIIARNNVTKVGTDTAVPHSKFSKFYFYTKDLISSFNIQYVVFGHIGDSHVHFNMLPKDETELKLCKELYRKICRKSVELGGTISAEHGIGKLKTQYLNEMLSEDEILQMAKLKKTFDPNLILNIGNIIEEKYLELV